MKFYLFLSVLSGHFFTGYSRLYQLNHVTAFNKQISLAHDTSIEVHLQGATDTLKFEICASPSNEFIIQQQFNSSSNSPVAESYELINDEGNYRVSLNPASIPNQDNNKITGSILIQSDYGCLNGNEYSKKSLLGLLSVIMVISTIIYFGYLKRNGDEVIRHHWALLILTIIASIEFMMHYFSVEYTNVHCVDNRILQFTVWTLRTFRDVGFVVMTIGLCQGWGITFGALSSSRMHQLTRFGYTLIIPCCLTSYAIVTVVDMQRSFSGLFKFGIFSRIFLQIIASVYGMKSLYDLKKTIKTQNQMRYNHLLLFEKIQFITTCGGFIYSYNVWWRANDHDWVGTYGIWDVLFVISLLTMLLLWRSPAHYNITNHVLNLGEIGIRSSKKNHINLDIGDDVEIERLLQDRADLSSSILTMSPEGDFNMDDLEDDLLSEEDLDLSFGEESSVVL